MSRGDPARTLTLTRRAKLDVAGRSQRFGAARTAREEDPPPLPENGERRSWSAEALLKRKAFEDLDRAELVAAERLLRRLARRLATRPSRRWVPVAGRGRIDLRRSFRQVLAGDGELLKLARRARRRERASLVALCDTSGSMDPHNRLLLAFALGLRRAATGTEVFAFNTRLTRLTRVLSVADARATLARLAAEVPDWSGGTRLGDCLAEFVARYLESTVRPATTVLILSDGLDFGDTATLTAAMRTIRARAGRVIWLNPLAGDPRYRPEARGMQAALPFVDHLLPADSLAALERALPLLAA